MPEKSVYRVVPFSKIIFGNRFRKEYEGIDDLALSIADKGNIAPMVLDTNLKILAGGRRYQAIEQLGWKEVGVLIRETDGELDAREIELFENVMRKDLVWQERVKLTKEIDSLYRKKYGDNHWSKKDTAELLGRSVGGVGEHLQLADALEIVPELEKLKTEDAAKKAVEALREKLALDELASRREDKTIPKDERLELLLQEAEKSYIVKDVFEALAEMPDHEWATDKYNINFIEVDPPYGIDLAGKKRAGKIVDVGTKSYVEIPKDEYEEFLHTLLSELYRITSPQVRMIFWFGFQWYDTILSIMEEIGWKPDYIPAIWTKGHGQTNKEYSNLARTYECFFYVSKNKDYRVKKGGRANVFDFRGVYPADKYHPTQRPLDLLIELIETFGAHIPKEKGVILVPFLGSGATILATNKMGYPAFGWDINPEYKEKFLHEVRRDYVKRFEM